MPIEHWMLREPRRPLPLEPDFRPAVLANRAFAEQVGQNGVPLIFGLQRDGNIVSRYETRVFAEDHPLAAANVGYAERLLKFLLWQRGGSTVYIGGPRLIGETLRETYSPSGARQFDHAFMGQQIYEQPFTIVPCAPEDVPPASEQARALGGHLNGCRIGFDLGASDRKISAVINGKTVYSEEVVWEPRKQADPDYHYREIRAAFLAAAEKMPRVDCIGGSSAGIIINNRPMVASLFRSVPPERFHEVHSLFQRLQQEFGVPLEVINDGDVTAIAGAMALDDAPVLGIALGSSEAAGYVDGKGRVMGWLNELAFAPVNYSPTAPVEEWSGDVGCGAQYFSQQCVFRLAPRAGIEIPGGITDAERLVVVQEHLESGHSGARQIWESMGAALGYALAHYADFYDMKQVLILGRCTSGSGGALLIDGARAVLDMEFPELASRIHLQLPDERTRRVGQSIAAASLPEIG